MDKLYYSIGEVAGILGESTSLVRFWSNYFKRFLKPQRGVRGNRLYKEDEVEMLKKIHLLVKSRGLTLDGAARELSGSARSVDTKIKALDSLKAIRAQLEEIKNSL